MKNILDGKSECTGLKQKLGTGSSNNKAVGEVKVSRNWDIHPRPHGLCDKINDDGFLAPGGTATVMREHGREAGEEARSKGSDSNSVTGWRDAGMDRKTGRHGHNWLCKCEDLRTEPTGLGTQCKRDIGTNREFHLSNPGRQSALP